MNKTRIGKQWCSPIFGNYTQVLEGRPSDEHLPPIDVSKFNGDFSWLKNEPSIDDLYMLPPLWRQTTHDRLADIKSQLKARRLTLPRVLEYFFLSEFNFVEKIFNSHETAFFVNNVLVDYPNPPFDASFCFFSNSRQDYLAWISCAETGSQNEVIVSSLPFDEPDLMEVCEDVDPLFSKKQLSFINVASSFEEFVYRIWVESKIYVFMCPRLYPEITVRLDPFQTEYLNAVRNLGLWHP